MIPAFYVFGANTDVGKTVCSGLLLRAVQALGQQGRYLKPVQTGFPESDDAQWVRVCSGFSDCSTIWTFSEPISPHRCLKEGTPWQSDEDLLEQCRQWLALSEGTVAQGSQGTKTEPSAPFVLIEGAGGVLSPTPSGRIAADVYRALRLPVILVGDPKLGGISATLSAYESLVARGYEIAMVLLFKSDHENAHLLREVLEPRGVRVREVSLPLSAVSEVWAQAQSGGDSFSQAIIHEWAGLVHELRAVPVEHQSRREEMFRIAQDHLWWPFTQHATTDTITAVDSAFGSDIVTSQRTREGASTPLRTQFDGSASWWTLGVGHGQPDVARAVGSALGRYGHVLFPEQVHEPAARLAETVVRELGGGRGRRVFFSDNGSTAVEVALKMAFRLATARGVLDPSVRPRVVGLEDSYHGDTLGAVNASSPNVFKSSERWYVPSGRWLSFPQVAMVGGQWKVMGEREDSTPQEFQSLGAVLDLATRLRTESDRVAAYRHQIQQALTESQHVQKSGVPSDIGAVLIEPLLHGSGGMIFVDPLVHYLLVTEAQARGIPVVFDEVFSGVWRLGAPTAAHLLGVTPDISCFSKALTGGALPLSVTLATDETFAAFQGPTKVQALLHGHSYTAHPAGCAAACESFRLYESLKQREDLVQGYWDVDAVAELSHSSRFVRTLAMGTVLACELKATSSGYASDASRSLVSELRAAGLQVRPLGPVVYLMTHPLASKSDCDRVLSRFIKVTSAF